MHQLIQQHSCTPARPYCDKEAQLKGFKLDHSIAQEAKDAFIRMRCVHSFALDLVPINLGVNYGAHPEGEDILAHFSGGRVAVSADPLVVGLGMLDDEVGVEHAQIEQHSDCLVVPLFAMEELVADGSSS